MATKTNAECLLNTTECMLQTVASILNEIQEQNSEYNWDPLTFIFTAIIGVIAIAFAALTAFQAFLTAGPGRTKSGAYAIGPWSRHNYRKFDWSEMRFRTVSSTPVLTLESLLKEPSEIDFHVEPRGLRKGREDYFPATWLALLTHLSLDYTTVWEQSKLTGADFIPSEFSAVPAYGSIRFVATLALILSEGFGRLTLDRESGLPRVRGTFFNLVFRQHPLLGVIGFFEIYGKMKSQQSVSPINIRRRFLEAHGQMNFPDPTPVDGMTNRLIDRGQLLTFYEYGGTIFDRLRDRVRRKCPHRNEEPKPACLNLSNYLEDCHQDFYIRGPLFLLMAHIPDEDFLPIIFPFRKAKLRERLDTLLLQSRSWGLKCLAPCDIFPYPVTNLADSGIDMTDTVNSWAKLTIGLDIEELHLDNGIYRMSLASLKETLQDVYNSQIKLNQILFFHQLKAIDLWLKQMEPYVLCRKLTLSIIGNGIQQIVDSVQEQPFSNPLSLAKKATELPNRSELERKLVCFLQAIKKPDCFNCLYTVWRAYTTKPKEAIHSTSESVKKIWDIWQRRETPLEGEPGESEDDAEAEKEYNSRTWKIPCATDHPLDGVLIYRAVLITLLYSLACDSSALISEDLGLIVPIM